MPGRYELIKQSREAALTAIKTYNDPLITFKSQSFIVLMIIAWTYLLHAYYKQKGFDCIYRAIQNDPKQKYYAQIRIVKVDNEPKMWELSYCLDRADCPLDPGTIANLEHLIRIRNKVEHAGAKGLDAAMVHIYQACAMNYCRYVSELFGENKRIDHMLEYSLQMSHLTSDQILGKPGASRLSKGLQAFIDDFERTLPSEVLDSPTYAVRIKMDLKAANNANSADFKVDFSQAVSDRGDDPSDRPGRTMYKERARKQFRPSTVWKTMQREGFTRFGQHQHTLLVRALEAKNEGKGWGIDQDGDWRWFDTWFDVVRKHCEENRSKYTEPATKQNDAQAA